MQLLDGAENVLGACALPVRLRLVGPTHDSLRVDEDRGRKSEIAARLAGAMADIEGVEQGSLAVTQEDEVAL